MDDDGGETGSGNPVEGGGETIKGDDDTEGGEDASERRADTTLSLTNDRENVSAKYNDGES